jgi:hypothetical protein
MKNYYYCTKDGKLIKAKITHKLPEFLMPLWKKTLCKIGWHLFDEVQSFDEHYLVCDACQMIIYIDRISMRWMNER